MNLYLMSQEINSGWDTYDSVVVAAESEQDARTMHPSEFVTHVTDNLWMGTYANTAATKAGTEYETENGGFCSWVEYSQIDQIKVEYLGETHASRGIILASFNAG